MSITNAEADNISLYNLGTVTSKILEIDQTFSISVKHMESKFATVKKLLSLDINLPVKL